MRPPPIGGGFAYATTASGQLFEGFNEAAADWRRIPSHARVLVAQMAGRFNEAAADWRRILT